MRFAITRRTINAARRSVSSSLIFGLLITLAATSNAYAHGGAIAVSGGARGPVQLSDAQAAAIALKTTEAGPHPLASLLDVNGEVELPPNRQAEVSLRISGQVKELYANLGDSVRAGQHLALIQGRLVGDPPATVTIDSPMNGVVDMRSVVLGQAVEPNTRLFHISDRTQMIVVGKVYEEDLGKIKVGQETHVRLLAYPAQVFAGAVTLIEPDLDNSSRTVKIWVQLGNAEGLLKPNMFARIAIVLQKNDASLSIPNDAIIEANGEKFVFVRDGKTFNRVEVTLGATDDQYSEVIDGLVPGDEVATQGNRQIYTMWLTGGQTTKEQE
jgi:cobalt-zinc-cadmium efflux system membrane fusion protein